MVTRREPSPGPRPTRLMHAALDAAAAGLYVFPVWPRGELPAVEDRENAAAVGRSRIVVVGLGQARGDAPPPGFPGASGGAEVLARLAEAAGQPDPTDTCSVTSPTGGEHRCPEGEVLRDIDDGIAYGENMPRIIRRGRQP